MAIVDDKLNYNDIVITTYTEFKVDQSLLRSLYKRKARLTESNDMNRSTVTTELEIVANGELSHSGMTCSSIIK